MSIVYWESIKEIISAGPWKFGDLNFVKIRQ